MARERKRSKKKVWQEAKFYSLAEVRDLLGKDKKIRWRGALSLLSRLRSPFGAFIGILAERKRQ